jgi:hypothetical protein
MEHSVRLLIIWVRKHGFYVSEANIGQKEVMFGEK